MSDEKPMMASELVALITAAIERGGDRPIWLRDSGMGWRQTPTLDPDAVDLHKDYGNLPPCMSISGEY